ncbi:hypothetical protein QYE76_045517 [Lolium multiflorum]|uniref:Splicing factor Cactin C-terminal domain-containing protein n=1 Tax=Lolium multiflorum TaxID=4521 RepID=A0AAD8TKK3_LOLMU|nr:hypothetical protein QYE76_045517 [Lolium multiflorum]
MQETIAARIAAGEAMVVEHWQGVTELIRVEKAKKYLQQNYSTGDEEPPSSDNKDDEEEPESADDGGDMADTDDAEGSDALCPVALPLTPSTLELRKPKYITRVRSGFEWNKYNRVHYDHDQPPPKIVKGYKFVVYYPDLAGTKPPEYTVHQDGESDETCIIRFHAGPPYDDIAFRIVNKEWEYSRKAGFKVYRSTLLTMLITSTSVQNETSSLSSLKITNEDYIKLFDASPQTLAVQHPFCLQNRAATFLSSKEDYHNIYFASNNYGCTCLMPETMLILLMDLHISYTIVCSKC